jgi:DNA ligase-1
MMQSDRHDSGFALRFPRIVRLRPDKSAEDADTIERVRELYASQPGDKKA